MKSWLELIRDARYLNLLLSNSLELENELAFRIPTGTGGITVQYEGIRIVNQDRGLPNPPTHIAVSDLKLYGRPDSCMPNIVPHDHKETPAQSAGNVAFIWSNPATKMTEVEPARDDGWPAVVLAVNLSKHYRDGKLSRNVHPALRAEFVAALWYDRPLNNYRSNGPSSITFEDYKEFWAGGEFDGHRWNNYELMWKHKRLDDKSVLQSFLNNLVGGTDLFGSRYFMNEEDEVCYIADFG